MIVRRPQAQVRRLRDKGYEAELVFLVGTPVRTSVGYREAGSLILKARTSFPLHHNVIPANSRSRPGMCPKRTPSVAPCFVPFLQLCGLNILTLLTLDNRTSSASTTNVIERGLYSPL